LDAKYFSIIQCSLLGGTQLSAARNLYGFEDSKRLRARCCCEKGGMTPSHTMIIDKELYIYTVINVIIDYSLTDIASRTKCTAAAAAAAAMMLLLLLLLLAAMLLLCCYAAMLLCCYAAMLLCCYAAAAAAAAACLLAAAVQFCGRNS
jgi:hypothetical protein